MPYHLLFCIDRVGRRHLLPTGRSTRQVTLAQGFTLIELLVTISVIAILLAILLPALSRAKEEVSVTSCLNNLRTAGMGQTMYHADNKEWFTPGQAYADGINMYIGVPRSDFNNPKWWTGRNMKSLCFPFKCPTRNSKGYGGSIGSSTIGSRPFAVTNLDYAANTWLHSAGVMDASLGGGWGGWIHTYDIYKGGVSPSEVLDMADGAGGNPRLDYSTFIMSAPHRSGLSTVMNFADAHAKAFYVPADQRVSGYWVSRDYCLQQKYFVK